MNPVHYLVYLFPIATLLALFAFFYWYWGTQRAPLAKRLITPPEEAPREQPRFTFAGRCHPLVRRDAIPILLITAVYAVTAFAHLGSLRAPQSAWDFGSGESATFSLPEAVQVSQLWYYPNLGTGKYQVEISGDGVTWLTLWSRTETDEAGSEETVYYWADSTGYGESFAMTQNYNQLFKWNEIVFENPQYIRYLRITGQANKGLLELGEVALFDMAGNRVEVPGSVSPLFDEQDMVPDKPTYYDEAYFDEIYHPRTAWEHIRGIEPYEISHPPLGKLIMGVGIRLFGMTPFGWRFMGTLFGVGMLPLLYVFLKNLFGRTSIATCGTILLAADFMHLTQTRLATIDNLRVFLHPADVLVHVPLPDPAGGHPLPEVRPAPVPVGAVLGHRGRLQVDGDLRLHRAGGALLHRPVPEGAGLAGGAARQGEVDLPDPRLLRAGVRRHPGGHLHPVLPALCHGGGGHQPHRPHRRHVGEPEVYALLPQRRHRLPPLFLPLVPVAL